MLGAFHKSIHPVVVSIAGEEKIIGHSLNGKHFILKPAKNKTTVRIRRQSAEILYTIVQIIFLGSITVTVAIIVPINISASPSVIHSIIIMFLLSALISPKSCTTFFVEKKCAKPQNKG
jgi:hypothetical protein